MSYRLIQRLIAVRDQFGAARSAMAYVERVWPVACGEPEVQGVRLGSLRSATTRLEDTYVIRLFSEFEGLLQYFIAYQYPARRVPRTADALINRVVLLERLPDPVREGAHRVRSYRNSVVHPAAVTVAPLTFPEALAALNRFLAPLPDLS